MPDLPPVHRRLRLAAATLLKLPQHDENLYSLDDVAAALNEIADAAGNENVKIKIDTALLTRAFVKSGEKSFALEYGDHHLPFADDFEQDEPKVLYFRKETRSNNTDGRSSSIGRLESLEVGNTTAVVPWKWRKWDEGLQNTITLVRGEGEDEETATFHWIDELIDYLESQSKKAGKSKQKKRVSLTPPTEPSEDEDANDASKKIRTQPPATVRRDEARLKVEGLLKELEGAKTQFQEASSELAGEEAATIAAKSQEGNDTTTTPTESAADANLQLLLPNETSNMFFVLDGHGGKVEIDPTKVYTLSDFTKCLVPLPYDDNPTARERRKKKTMIIDTHVWSTTFGPPVLLVMPRTIYLGFET